MTKLIYFVIEQNEDIENIIFDMNYGPIHFTHEIMLLFDLLHRKDKMPIGYDDLYELNVDFECKQHIVTDGKLQNLLPAYEYCKNKKLRTKNNCDIVPVMLETLADLYCVNYGDPEEINDTTVIESVDGFRAFIESVQFF